MDWTEAELAYLAGIIDGEGCLSMSCVGSCRFTAQVFIGNTDARLIQWVHARFGGTVHLRKRKQKATHKPLWMWTASGPTVATVLTAVLPYLLLKKEQALLLLEYRKTVNAVGTNRSLSDETNETRKSLKSRLLVLNKRGVA